MTNLPPLPPGASWLTPDEAAFVIALGDHKEAAKGGLLLDDTLIGLVRKGLMHAAKLADGTLVFTPDETFVLNWPTGDTDGKH